MRKRSTTSKLNPKPDTWDPTEIRETFRQLVDDCSGVGLRVRVMSRIPNPDPSRHAYCRKRCCFCNQLIEFDEPEFWISHNGARDIPEGNFHTVCAIACLKKLTLRAVEKLKMMYNLTNTMEKMLLNGKLWCRTKIPDDKIR